MNMTGSLEQHRELIFLVREEVKTMRTKCVFTTNFNTLNLLEKVTDEFERIILENEELRNR